MKKAVFVVFVVLACLAIACVGWRGFSAWTIHQAKKAHYRAVAEFLDSVEEAAAWKCFRMAREYLDERTLGEVETRLEYLGRRRALLDLSLSEDSYSSVVREISQKSYRGLERRLVEEGVLYGDGDTEAYSRVLVEALSRSPVRQVNQIDRTLNDLYWNMAGYLWEDAFGTEYTLKELEEDKKEFLGLRYRMEELLADKEA